MKFVSRAFRAKAMPPVSFSPDSHPIRQGPGLGVGAILRQTSRRTYIVPPCCKTPSPAAVVTQPLRALCDRRLTKPAPDRTNETGLEAEEDC